MTVTACLVTRNHDTSVGRAIRSVTGLTTQVIVADTGSTDRTTLVAAELGARVIEVPWDNDFAAACNAALAAAEGEWVLWLNPDEEVSPKSLPLLVAAMAQSGTFAWRARVRQEHDPDRFGEGMDRLEFRLFRRHPELRYRGRLHPQFLPPLEEVAGRNGKSIGTTDAVIHRHAYLSRPTPDKVRWVVGLLEAELRDRPGQLGFLIELGRNLLLLNDPRGHEVLGDAAEQVRQLAGCLVSPSPWVGSLIEYILSVSPGLSRSTITREEARKLAARWFPNTPPVVWAVAGERFAAGDFPLAASLLDRLVQMGRTRQFDAAGDFAPEIIGAAAIMNLGLCNLHLGRWGDAKRCFSEVVDDPGHRDAALRGYRLAELRQPPSA